MVLEGSGILASGGTAVPVCAGAAAALQRALQHARGGGYEEESGEGGKDQAADYGPAQRSVLLAAIAQPQRHRHHADDHRQCGHQHGTETCESSSKRGSGGVAVIDLQLLLGEG